MNKNLIKHLTLCLLFAASLSLASQSMAATIAKEEPSVDEGSSIAATPEAMMSVQEEADAIDLNQTTEKLIHQKQKSVLYETLEDFRTRLVGVSLQDAASKMQREQIEMPRFYEFVHYASDATTTNVARSIQEDISGITSLQYLTGREHLGLQPADIVRSKSLKYLFDQQDLNSLGLAQRKNPYIASKEAAISAVYSSYNPYFCMPGSKNAPTGCGNLAFGSPLANSLVSGLVGDTTWSADIITPSRDFFRVYFGLMSDRVGLPSISSGSLVDYLRDATQANMRLSVLQALMARRTAAIGAGNSDNIAGGLFRTFEEAGYLSDNDPVSLCSDPGKRSPISAMLCEMLDKNFSSSQAVVERVLNHDIYLTPTFLEDINAREYPAKASLLRLEVYMTAQKLAQEYRFLRDLQMYTALRAMNISNGLAAVGSN